MNHIPVSFVEINWEIVIAKILVIMCLREDFPTFLRGDRFINDN